MSLNLLEDGAAQRKIATSKIRQYTAKQRR